MRYFVTFLMLLCWSWMLLAQQKLVVTGSGEVIPLKKGESSFDVVKRLGVVKPEIQSNACGSSATFGYTPETYSCTLDFVGYHRDVWGEWFEAPADGRIDSFYFRGSDQNEMADSSVKIHIWRSTIHTGSGPGNDPYPPARSAWGYYPTDATFDDDQHLTPYPWQANGSWISTVEDQYPGTPSSFPPYDSLLWPGQSGVTFKAKMVPGAANDGNVNGLRLKDYLPTNIVVTKGFPIFVTLQQQGSHGAGGDNSNPATWCQSGTSGPTRNWKFYEHAAGPSKGWQARGEANWNWWIVMTATSDVPPKFLSIDKLGHTLASSTRHLQAHIQDCNPQLPARAGVQSATLTYWEGFGTHTTVALSHTGGDLYEADIPGYSADARVSYYMTAVDSNANSTNSLTVEYSVVRIGNSYYGTDTSAAYSWVEINSTGHRIAIDKGENADTSWFNNLRGGSGVVRDDGSWGPADLGAWFTYFGDSVHYAWIGTNGALALTKSITDTQEIVGRGGSVPSSWVLPGRVLAGNNDLPHNLVSPYLNDYTLAPDSVGYEGAHGNVYFQADVDRFIVEWDSAGILHQDDTLVTFQVIFDNTDQSIKFQYKHIGLGTAADLFSQAELVGIQADTGTTTRFIMLNKNGYPSALQPRNLHAFRFYSEPVPVSVSAGWNMVSVPITADNYSKAHLFPSAISNAFGYQGGYTPADPLSIGSGYWLKFAGDNTLYLPQMSRFDLDTITLNAKWNMIGSVSGSVPVASVSYLPDESTVKGSNFFGFSSGSGYSTATSIDPGKGYWFKSKIAGGQIVLLSTSNTPKSAPQKDALTDLNQITVSDARGSHQTLYFGSAAKLSVSPEVFEMPPAPPSGSLDVRYTSQRMVEVHPANLTGSVEYPVQIQSAVYPITVSWELKQSNGVGYDLVDMSGGKEVNSRALKANGSIKVATPVQGLVIRAKAVNTVMPSSYALEQNYPNPFNPTTELKYALPQDSHVRLVVFNVIGQEIATLVDEVQQAGYHEVTWDSHNFLSGQVGSGVYFYRIDATNISDAKDVFSQVRKMILLK